jgi:hypothetical protein
VDALLVGWGGVVVPACFGDEFAPAFGSMLFMDEWWWCRLWCDRASAALAKLSAATATMAIPKYLIIIGLFLQRFVRGQNWRSEKVPQSKPA